MKIFIYSLIVLLLSELSLASTSKNITRRHKIIKNLHKVIDQSAQGQVVSPIYLRLADTLSDQARDISLEDLNNSCTKCTAANPYRIDSIKYYKKALPYVDQAQQQKIYFKMAHLYNLMGRSDDSINLFRSILSKYKNKEILGQTNLSLAEAYFKKKKFESAIKYYKQAQNFKSVKKTGLLNYRLAWSYYRIGLVEQGSQYLEKIVKNPKMQTRGNVTKKSEVDTAFLAEVTGDLALFYAQKGKGLSHAKYLYSKSPEKVKNINVETLATELNRLGFAENSLEVWSFALKVNQDVTSQITGLIEVTQILTATKKTDQAILKFDQAVTYITKKGDCQKLDCSIWQSSLKNILLDIHRLQRGQPSTQLLTSYGLYLEIYPSDIVSSYFASEVAEEHKQWVKGIDFISQAQINYTKDSGKITYEMLLLRQIELSELSAQPLLQKNAYETYLRLSKTKSKRADVLYQKAYLLYKQENHQAAFVELNNVSLDKEIKNKSLKLKAADLALDCLKTLNNHSMIEKWSIEYSKIFPSRYGEYQKMARNAVMKQSQKLVQQASLDVATGQASLLLALDQLDRFNFKSSSQQEKEVYFKNKIIITEKLKRYQTAYQLTNQFLKERHLTKESKVWALKKKVWYGDLLFNFKDRLSAESSLNPRPKKANELLRRAVLADLAGMRSDNYYDGYLKLAKKDTETRRVVYQLAEKSSKPITVLQRYRSQLKGDEEPLAAQVLEYSSGDLFEATKTLKRLGLTKTSSWTYLDRVKSMNSIFKHGEVLKNHKLNTKSVRSLKNSIKKRNQYLLKAKKYAEKASARSEWTTQLLSFYVLKKELLRFYDDLLSLPVPEGLSEKEQAQYLSLLEQQAEPYKQQGDSISTQWQSLYDQLEQLIKFNQSLEQSKGGTHKLLVAEAELLKVAIPSLNTRIVVDQKAPLETNKVVAGNQAEIKSTISELKKTPFSKSLLNTLLSLEKERGNEIMVSYLKNRIQTLDKMAKE